VHFADIYCHNSERRIRCKCYSRVRRAEMSGPEDAMLTCRQDGWLSDEGLRESAGFFEGKLGLSL